MPSKLMQLLRDNAQATAKAPIHAEKSGSIGQLYVYDVIVSDDYWGGVGAETFVKAHRDLEADDSVSEIHTYINSPGGDVFAARAMEAAVRACKKKTVAHVDGYAASAASYFALAFDEVEIAQGGFFMIHKAWTVGWGNADDLLATAALLEKIDASLVDTYAAETGLPKDEIAAMMSAETWLTSAEAVEKGFADRVAEDVPKASSGWNLAAYANAPAQTAERREAAPVGEPEPAEPQAMEEPTAPAYSEEHRKELFARVRRIRANRR